MADTRYQHRSRDNFHWTTLCLICGADGLSEKASRQDRQGFFSIILGVLAMRFPTNARVTDNP
jgi:hypothetical protein